MSEPATLAAAVPSPSKPKPAASLIAWIQRRPEAAFCLFLAIHFAVWTALPSILYANLPLDLIEALTYGREWPIGSDKLPPLPWWMVEIAYRLFGTDIAYYAMAETAIVVAFSLIWAVGRPLVGPVGALVAVLIIDGIHYFQYTAVKYNHDVIQLPFWALAGYAFHAALKRGHLGHWLLLGFAFGGALWAKYFVIVLAVPYGLFLLFDRDARPALRTPGPWLGMALALAIASPHLIWLVQNNFLPFNYVDARSPPARSWYDHILHPIIFIAGQISFLFPALAIAAMLVWPRAKQPVPPSGAVAATEGRPGVADAFDRRIITLLAFGPPLAMLALIGVSGRGTVAMWGYPLWCFIGLWIVLFTPTVLDATRLRRVVIAWSVVSIALVIGFTADYTVLPSLDHRGRAAFFPGDQLAAQLTQSFHTATNGKKLDYVIASMWVGGNVAHYSPDHPSVLIDGLPRRAPWIDLYDLRAKGALLVWNGGDLEHPPPEFTAIAPGAQVGKPFTLRARRFGAGVEHIGWAILQPK